MGEHPFNDLIDAEKAQKARRGITLIAALTRTSVAARALYILAWIYGSIGALGSLALMNEKSTVGLGLASLLGVMISTAFLVLIALWADAWAASKLPEERVQLPAPEVES